MRRLSVPMRRGKPRLYDAAQIMVDWRLADGRGLKQGGNPLEDPVHAQVGVHGGVDFVMVGAGVHDQNLRSCVGLLDHVGQVMAIVLGQGGAEDDQVKGIAAQGFLNAMTVQGSGHVMSGFFHFGGLGGKSVFVRLAIENLDRSLVSGLVSGRGQGASWNSLGA